MGVYQLTLAKGLKITFLREILKIDFNDICDCIHTLIILSLSFQHILHTVVAFQSFKRVERGRP